MKLPPFLRRIFRFIVLIKRTVDEQFINQGKFLIKTGLHAAFKISDTLVPLLSLVAFGIIINDIGFNPFYGHHTITHRTLVVCLFLLKTIMVVRFIAEWQEDRKLKAHLYSLFLVVLVFYLYEELKDLAETPVIRNGDFLKRKVILYAGITFLFLNEASAVLRFLYRKSLNPSFIFIVSFAGIILIGGLLLMLPNATTHGISAVNALFTSASAVCVTGLIVVDTATAFTPLGKVIILGLFQIGGIGIMTFTALLAYLAIGSVSFQGQLALKDMLHSSRLSNVIQLITRIIVVTFFFEFIGALLIHWSVGEDISSDNTERITFAVFHSISAFCNAGFSTLSQGLYSAPVRFNYSLQIVIALLVILGGLGFPIVFNLFTFLRVKTINLVRKILKDDRKETYTRVLNVNSRLAVTSSAILLAIGFVMYALLEQNHTLLEHPSLLGKIVTSFFGSVTPRTAGFNTVDTSLLSLPTVMVYLLLMYIGASPASTGGGIKTTTASVAFLNLISVVRGKNRTEVFHTQISEHSINKAFAIIILSLLGLGLTVLLLAINDGDKGLLRIAFEGFSAFSTVGLSLGVTPELSSTSKVVLIFAMFIGRVGALTILIAFAHQIKQLYYRYPTEEILL